jgi:hypothetical protein
LPDFVILKYLGNNMLGLTLRDEFLGDQMPGTAISLRTSDNQGAVQKSPDYILSISYPTADVQTALRAISSKRSGRSVVLMGERGRGKSHIMAIMHHAVQSPEVVEGWIRSWGAQLGSEEISSFEMTKGFFPISEPVHNHEYPLLWNLLFERHPRGEYYRGQFEQMGQPYPPRTLLERMFEEQPTCLILDEFQTWFTGLQEHDPRTGSLPRQWAFNFTQNLSEIAKERPEILIFVISVLDNQNNAFQQVHRQGPVLVDFRGPTAKHDRQRLLLHRLFENRSNISDCDIGNIAGVYADERFRLLHTDKSESEKDRLRREVLDCWPFSPELLNLIENQILLSQAAQETRDLIRILAQVYKSRGDKVPVMTAADFHVDGDTGEVQSLVDAIAVQAGQERLRQIAQINLQAVRDAGATVPDARELISSIWMRSMSPARHVGGTPAELHLDITRQQTIDDNFFQAELTLLIDNSVNIHGDQPPGGPLWFGFTDNPRSKVRSCAKNNRLWHPGAVVSSGQTVYPGKDIEHIRSTLRHLFVTETREPLTRIIVLGPDWNSDPWGDLDEAYKPAKWDRPVLIVIPEQIAGGPAAINSCLGQWLAAHVTTRRNTVRFLLLAGDGKGIYSDNELVFSARCSFLCSKDGWGSDSIYRNLLQDFDRPLRQALRTRFDRFALLRQWDFQQPQNCVFEVEKIVEQGVDIPPAVERKILSDLFDRKEFNSFITDCAKSRNTVGEILSDLLEPPPAWSTEAIPFLGETKLYEFILEMTASALIVLNVGGSWIGRRPEDETDEDALRYIRTKAFKTGQEMRQVILGLPGDVGGGTVPGLPPSQPTIPTGGTAPTTATIAQPAQIPNAEEKPGGGAVADGGAVRADGETTPASSSQTQVRRSEEPATAINLSGCFEKWGIPSDTSISTARIEFSGLTAQQVRQILTKIPSAYKATLEITYTDGEAR